MMRAASDQLNHGVRLALSRGDQTRFGLLTPGLIFYVMQQLRKVEHSMIPPALAKCIVTLRGYFGPIMATPAIFHAIVLIMLGSAQVRLKNATYQHTGSQGAILGNGVGRRFREGPSSTG